MPHRSTLSAAERDSLLALPGTEGELIRYYTLSESDLASIRQRRGAANRVGFAFQLCYLRFPDTVLGVGEPPFPPLLNLVAAQLKVPAESWGDYGQREQTRRKPLGELHAWLGMSMFSAADYRRLVHQLAELAQRAHKELGLAVETDCERFPEARLAVLQEQPATAERLAAANELPDAAITRTGRLKISPLDNGVPDEAEVLMQQTYSLLPHLKITELLQVEAATDELNPKLDALLAPEVRIRPR